MSPSYSHIVIGAGAIGSAAAYWLTRKGAERVVVIEQYALNNTLGSSGDHSRIIRHAYHSADYTALTRDMFSAWEEIEARSGLRLYTKTGGLDLAHADTTGHREVLAYQASLDAFALPYEVLDVDDIRRRYPQWRLDDDVVGLFQSDGGLLDIRKSVSAHTALALAAGVEFRPYSPVTGIEITTDSVRVTTPGDVVHAEHLVVAVGEMPWDVFGQSTTVAPADPLPVGAGPPVDGDRIAQAADLIDSSDAPMIFVGSGALGAHAEILELAEKLEAPVVAFRSGRGVVSNAHELGLTLAAAWELWPETDLVIGIGTRMELPRWRWPPTVSPDRRWIRVDIDPVEMRRFPCDVEILADAATAVSELLAAVERDKPRHRVDRIREATRTADRLVQAVQPQVDYLTVLRRVLPDGAIVTDELSQVGFASWYGFPVYRPRTFLSSGYEGTLGSGFPTALGAKVAHPGVPVVAICGDGGFLFASPELATAVQYDIAVVILVFDNHSYGNVRRDQQRDYGGRLIGSDLTNPDFVQMARSFGVEATRVSTPAAFGSAVECALAADGPYLIAIDIPTGTEKDPWTLIHPAGHRQD